MRIAGIDPGLKGGYSEVTQFGKLLVTMELQEALSCLVARVLSPDHIFVERAQVMIRGNIRPSAVASFNYGRGFGEILGIICALQIPHTQVPPAIWTKIMHAGTKATDDTKARSLEAACRLFPGQSWLVGRGRKPHDGLTESALIAEYGRRVLHNQLDQG